MSKRHSDEFTVLVERSVSMERGVPCLKSALLSCELVRVLFSFGVYPWPLVWFVKLLGCMYCAFRLR